MTARYSRLETDGSSNESIYDKGILLNNDYLDAAHGDLSDATTEADDIDHKVLLKKQSIKRIFGYPISIPFIIANEFCERFSYYGMRTVLTLYMTKKLLMSKEDASDWYHEFVALCYATPLLGALIADVFLGKFMTIMLLSIVYCTGNAVMALTAVGKWDVFQEGATSVEGTEYMDFQPHIWGPLIGLHLIALGTGGIKPCVSSFGGDQFMKSESSRLQRFFSMFYFSINAGSMVATLMTPELRAAKCLGEETCYPLAFGVPAVFMVVAVVAFVVASRWYVMIPPLGNPIIDVAKVSMALIRGKSPEQLYGAKKVADVRQLYRVLCVFIPFPFFWALFEQQGSRWVVQADRMDGRISGFELKPDQMQVFNPVLILCLIPTFEVVVYPLMRKIGLPTRRTTTQTGNQRIGRNGNTTEEVLSIYDATFRMISGMVLVSSSFVICGFVQLAMENRVTAWNEANPDLTPATFETLDKTQQLHILTTIPQIFVITCGEILCSITALEFAYAYAPQSMKSVCQSMFLLTNACGNICVIIFTKITKEDLYLYFMWAAIELGAAFLMYYICRRVQAPLDAYKNAGAAPKDTVADAQEMEAGSNGTKALAAPYEE